jgi:formate dehydrogenase subunit gamma
MGRATGDQAPPGRIRSRRGAQVVERHNRATRWFHAATYAAILVLLATGWWLLGGQEGHATPVARLTGVPDPTLHRWVGWALVGTAAAGLTFGVRAARTFVAESIRFRRDDLRWFARWPAATVTGRFRAHDGLFDPGQRVANLLVVGLMVALVASGAGLSVVLGGPAFVWLRRVHVWATWAVTPVLLGHVLVASGVLPGYRGVARSMHGGRLRVEVARRLWPGWLARAAGPRRPGGRAPSGGGPYRRGGEPTGAPQRGQGYGETTLGQK